MNCSSDLLCVPLRATDGTDRMKEVAKEQGVTALYTDWMSIDFRYNVFCINFMHINGRTVSINFRCLAILLAQQAVSANQY